MGPQLGNLCFHPRLGQAILQAALSHPELLAQRGPTSSRHPWDEELGGELGAVHPEMTGLQEPR